MSEATEVQLRDMMSGLDEISSDTVSLYLDFAKNELTRRGYLSSHDYYQDLQLNLAAHLMTLDNIGNSDIKSESVGDVSISYGKNAGQLDGKYSNNWERRYHQILVQIEGLEDRCL